jgi:hypothetical protein
VLRAHGAVDILEPPSQQGQGKAASGVTTSAQAARMKELDAMARFHEAGKRLAGYDI